ncbi:MAG: hypothetical protein NTY80_03715 [candidate division SR1 bacterium]|nr:hypothetical protein [candidate division SR1 bacterium]
MKKMFSLEILPLGVLGVLFSFSAVLAFNFIGASWHNIDRPTRAGDYELFTNPCGILNSLVAVEVKTSITKSTFIFTGSTYTGMLFGRYVHVYGPLHSFAEKNGVFCVNKENSTKKCLDYQVRFACSPNQTRSNQTGSNQTGSNRTGSNQTGSNQTGSNRTGSNQTRSNQTGSNQTGSNRTGSNQTGSNQTGSNQTGSNRTGSNQTGSNQTGSNRTGSNQTGSNQTGSNRTGSNQTGSNQIKQGLIKQDFFLFKI